MLASCCIIFALFIRFFVLSVWSFESRRMLVCELELCKKNSEKGDLLLANVGGNKAGLLWLAGKSGDEIDIPTHFDTVSFRVPDIGDTIVLDSINQLFWDAAFTMYKEQFPNENAETKISLWSKEAELPFSYVGRASISGRPVSEREVAFLPHHELRLLELQLQRIFPAIDSIHFKRKILADSVEVESFIVENELFYLTCGGKDICYDSRERGFFRKKDLFGISIFPTWL